MRKTLLALLVFPLIACGGVPEKEAKQTLTGLESILGADESMRAMLLIGLCMESDTCSGSCKDVIKAVQSIPPDLRIRLVHQCDSNVKPLPGQSEREAFDTWLVGYVDGYLKKVRAALPEADRGRLDKAWAAFLK